MAIIKFGPTVIGARGLIAGTIFSANLSGPFARAWSRGANPRTALQSAHRGIIGSMSTTWRALTQVQRDDWIDYAADPAQEKTNSLGDDYFASGFNWYVAINEHLLANGDSLRVDAPTLTRPAVPIVAAGTRLKITSVPAESTIFMANASPNLGFPHIVFVRIVTQGRSAIASGLSFIIIDVPEPSRNVFIQPEIESVFGTIVLGQRMFFSVQSQDPDGQRSPKATGFRDAEV